tara:strand:- start:438 stop:1145 length:708 start_codon:yes stop_codon:yes gene_type:complete
MSEDKVLVIIPTYNEDKIIGDVIINLKKYFSKVKIVIIDGYSTDSTVKIAKQSGAETILIDNYFGIGLAIEAGIKKAKLENFDFLIRVDGDGQHPAKDVKNLFDNAVENNIDLTIGSRFLDKSDYQPNNIRALSIKLLSKLIKIFYKVEVKDCTSGCQIFNKRLITELAQDENFEYSEVGVICKTAKIKFSIKEYFINMQERKTGQSSFNFINSFKYMFKNLLALITSVSFNIKK